MLGIKLEVKIINLEVIKYTKYLYHASMISVIFLKTG